MSIPTLVRLEGQQGTLTLTWEFPFQVIRLHLSNQVHVWELTETIEGELMTRQVSQEEALRILGVLR